MVRAHTGPPDTRKRTVTLRLDSALVEAARAQGVNLSQFLEARLREAIREPREQAWRDDNRDAIREYNEVVASRGSFGDHSRRF